MSEDKTIPYVSVVMPVFNAEIYIFDVIDKVRKQTLKSLEIIIVDDNSTDSTKAILERIAAEDDRVILLSGVEGGGAGAARNVGLSHARGEFVVFLDDDDFVDENLMEKAYSMAKSHDADVVIYRSQFYNVQQDKHLSIPWSIRTDLLPQKNVFSSVEIEKDFFNAFVWWPWDKMLKRERILAEGLQFQQIRTSNDLYFICAFVLLSEKICILDDVLIDHTVSRETSLSNTREKSYHCAIDALEALRSLMIERGFYDGRKIDFINYSASFLEWHLNTLYGKAYFTLYEDVRNYLNKLGAKFEDLYEERTQVFFDSLYRLSADDYLFYLSRRLQNENDELVSANYDLSSANRETASSYQILSTSYQDACAELKRKEELEQKFHAEQQAIEAKLSSLEVRLRAHEEVILEKAHQLRDAEKEREALTHQLKELETHNREIVNSWPWRMMALFWPSRKSDK
ncbi:MULTISPECIES: glycosyltransferase family 2 protein [Serratia]|uniref:glycosyltransferase family 2 protein n=1 Tax=Serratia TaxID=613 RepID=UPI0018D48BF4|nr:glycosyltransferase [Serratia marcescens]MBH1914337.1 glycosyltransferase [Serratia marcescens]MBH2677176.1 glycosyltransferase [Serratia marcescens]MBN3976683.1 glycosyltransferase [Serratia marcescens]